MKKESWYRLELFTDRPNSVAAELFKEGALGVETQDQDTFEADPIPDGFSRIIAFFEHEDDSRTPPPLNTAHRDLVFQVYDDLSWRESWKRFFRPVVISPRIIVGPPWEDFSAAPSGYKIEIEPGMAFGTGTHETTQVCGEILEFIIGTQKPATMLDVGCGSGILSIAAAKLGLKEIWGIDNDATAVDVARENARINHVGEDLLRFSTQWEKKTYDLVVANILAHILLSLRDDLYQSVNQGGRLILSGITDVQISKFQDDFLIPGWEIDDASNMPSRSKGEWRALVLKRSQ